MNRSHSTVDAILYDISEILLDDYIIKIERCVKEFDYDSFSFNSLNKKIEAIANSLAKKARKRSKYTKRVAAIIIAIILAIMLAMSVEAIREYVINFFMEIYDKYSVAHYVAENDHDITDYIYADTIEDYYKPSYIPEGYDIVSEDKDEYSYVVKYKNKLGMVLIYKQNCYKYTYAFDNENIQTEVIEIEDILVRIVENEGTYKAFWFKNGCNYTILGDISNDDIVNIIRSLETIS